MNLRQTTGNVLHRLPQSWKDLVPSDTRYRLRRQLGRSAWDIVSQKAPALRRGESPGKPDFIGVGVQKAGTTRWFQLIAAHPGVSDSIGERKELHYFSRFAAASYGRAEIAEYERWFPRIGGAIVGEWSPDYFYLPWVPQLVSMTAPQARLMVCLRDPIERLRSGLALSAMTMNGPSSAVAGAAIRQGCYAECLRAWLRYFPREQILVLQHERNVADPESQLRRTYAFLGLDPGYVPGSLRFVYGETTNRQPVEPDILERLCQLYLPDVIALHHLVPDLDISMWPNFAQRVRLDA